MKDACLAPKTTCLAHVRQRIKAHSACSLHPKHRPLHSNRSNVMEGLGKGQLGVLFAVLVVLCVFIAQAAVLGQTRRVLVTDTLVDDVWTSGEAPATDFEGKNPMRKWPQYRANWELGWMSKPVVSAVFPRTAVNKAVDFVLDRSAFDATYSDDIDGFQLIVPDSASLPVGSTLEFSVGMKDNTPDSRSVWFYVLEDSDQPVNGEGTGFNDQWYWSFASVLAAYNSYGAVPTPVRMRVVANADAPGGRMWVPLNGLRAEH